MNQKEITEVVGFDLGHGETTLSITNLLSSNEPKNIEILGSKTTITAIAEHNERGVIIGEDAYESLNSKYLDIGFKSFNLNDPDKIKPLKAFIKKIKEILINEKNIKGLKETLFIVGCPAGWNQTIQQKYKKIFLEAGYMNVEIIPEPRAAFIFSKDNGELSVSSNELVAESALVIDLGSSTTDFTAINKLHYIPKDFGNNFLGGSLIDELIFNHSLKKHPSKKQLEKIFYENPTQKQKCILSSRKLKEKYFSNEVKWTTESVNKSQRIPYSPPIYFDIELKKEDMDKILDSKIESLNNSSWKKAFLNELVNAKEEMKKNPPKIVLITGGTSKIGFIKDYCEDVFSEARIIKGNEPEFTISKGLSKCGKIDINIKQFNRDINALFTSGKIEQKIDEKIPDLIELLSKNIVNHILFNISFNAFKDWKKGDIITLNDLAKEVEYRTTAWIKSNEGNKLIINTLIQWISDSRDVFENVTNPICDKYNLPRNSLNVTNSIISDFRLIVNSDTDFGDLTGLDDLLGIIGIVGALIIATLLGGGGVALLMTGPVGWIIGLIIGAIAMGIGFKKAKEKIMHSNIPLVLRKTLSDKKIENKFNSEKEILKEKIKIELLSNSKYLEDIKENISINIKNSINSQIDEIGMLIK